MPPGNEHYTAGPDHIYRPEVPVSHRSDEYNEAGFDVLQKMQESHFWYRGRHRFLLSAVRRLIGDRTPGRACDVGGGCGGWIRYLQTHAPDLFSELAMTDSSTVALTRAGELLGPGVRRYHDDVLNLRWHDRWDTIFLLDVLEHIPDDRQALERLASALRPGGLLFVTMPALNVFWSYTDDVAHHQRRYRVADVQRLAGPAGLELVDARYFMFFLSPLLYMFRPRRSSLSRLTREQLRDRAVKASSIPPAPVNLLLTGVFAAETPIGHWWRFPWGTSVLGVFRKVI